MPSSRIEFTGSLGHTLAGRMDRVAAADWLRAGHGAPALLVGHSLGGAAVLAAAHRIADARAVVTLGAPFEPAHVIGHLGESLAVIEAQGQGRYLPAVDPTVSPGTPELLQGGTVRVSERGTRAFAVVMGAGVSG